MGSEMCIRDSLAGRLRLRSSAAFFCGFHLRRSSAAFFCGFLPRRSSAAGVPTHCCLSSVLFLPVCPALCGVCPDPELLFLRCSALSSVDFLDRKSLGLVVWSDLLVCLDTYTDLVRNVLA